MSIAVASAYRESSQYKRWTLSTETLSQRRQAANSSTIETIRRNLEEEVKLSGKPSDKAPDFPNAEEELLIVNYYATKVFDTGAVFNLPSHLKATAAAYLKRFYLSKSPLQYHPKSIMITSLFLATKTCEHHIDLETFVSRLPKQSFTSVLEHEFLISSTIDFDFVHWSAYRPLYGFILDMENELTNDKSQQFPLTDINKTHDTAKALINSCAWSDLPFLYSPSHLALAALYNSNDSLLRHYVKLKNLENLMPEIEDIAQIMTEVSNTRFDTPEIMAKVKATDRKLYYSKDPALKVDSALYKRRLEDSEREEGAKRRKKGDAARESLETFGNVLS